MKQRIKGWMQLAVAINLLAGLVTMTPAAQAEFPDVPVEATLDVAAESAGATRSFQPVDGLTGAGVTVAVLDSGIAPHPDLGDRVLARVDMVSPTGQVVPGDPYGHGTHVAGIIAGDGSRSGGFYRGIAPGAGLVSVRVLDAHGTGMASDVVEGIDWVIANRDLYGIRIVNISVAHPELPSDVEDPMVLAVERAVEAGLFVVCTAGNQGAEGPYSIASPGTAPSVTTVGSADDGNTVNKEDDRPSDSSSIGPTNGKNISKPDMVAPGEHIVSLRVPGSWLDLDFPEWRVSFQGEEDYFEMTGSSMAAPMVSGAAALLLERYPDLNPATLKARLMNSARHMEGQDILTEGSGMLDVEAALLESAQSDDPRSSLVRFTSDGEPVREPNTLLVQGE